MSLSWLFNTANPKLSVEEVEPKVLHSLGSRAITVYGDQVIKSGSPLRGHEVSNLRFVAEHTTLPVPRVYKVEPDKDGNVSKIYMDYMPGRPLDEAWSSMTEEQRLSVAEELRDYVTQLRSLKGDYIGAADRGSAVIMGQCVFHEGGPFDNEHQFNQFLFSKIIKKVPNTLRYHATKTFRDNHSIVFTHGDLAPRNILVAGGHVTAILDWENAGWYPEYWEHVTSYREFNAVPKWLDYVDIFLPRQYSEEVIAVSYLSHFSG